MKAANNEHINIIAFIREKDLVKAKELNKIHLNNSKIEVLNYFRNKGSF